MISAQNLGRLPIVSDTTRSVRIFEETEDPEREGWWIRIDCPVFGRSFDGPFETKALAESVLEEEA